jgi:hypothetical protein
MKVHQSHPRAIKGSATACQWREDRRRKPDKLIPLCTCFATVTAIFLKTPIGRRLMNEGTQLRLRQSK